MMVWLTPRPQPVRSRGCAPPCVGVFGIPLAVGVAIGLVGSLSRPDGVQPTRVSLEPAACG